MFPDMNTAIYVVFALTYMLIASRRLSLLPIGRPAGALLGAVLMVLIGALSPKETYDAIDYDTIVLLFGTMVLTVYLERAGFFEWLARMILSACKTPMTLLWAVAALSGTLSAFLVNDTVCVFLTPVVVAACRRGNLPPGPYLIGLATSANIGSAATLVGNPQNMIIGSLSGFPFGQFVLFAAPAAGIGLVLNMLLLYLFYYRRLPPQMEHPASSQAPVDRRNLLLAFAVTIGVILGFFAGFHLGYTTLTGVVILILADRTDPRDIFARVDWSLLLFFCCLFVVVSGLAKTGIVERSWKESAPYLTLHHTQGLFLFSALMTIGSNLVSNVPMVLLTGPHLSELGSAQLGWVLLAFTTTVAGNFTLIGSVANIIVAERARDHYALGFVEYLRFGLPSTIIVLAAGVTTIFFVMAG
jgi:Na+/H+ antiporter NhaD/arsenite permease-like protein